MTSNDTIPKNVIIATLTTIGLALIVGLALGWSTTPAPDQTSLSSITTGYNNVCLGAGCGTNRARARRCSDVHTMPSMGAGSVIAETDDNGNRTITFSSDDRGVVTCHDETGASSGDLTIGSNLKNCCSFNVAIGIGALDTLTTGSRNFAIGRRAGSGIVSGSGNIIVGDQVGDLPRDLHDTLIIYDRAGRAAITIDERGTTFGGR